MVIQIFQHYTATSECLCILMKLLFRYNILKNIYIHFSFYYNEDGNVLILRGLACRLIQAPFDLEKYIL